MWGSWLLRDGHYPLWGYAHAVVRSDSTGATRTTKFSSYLSGELALPGADVVTLTAKAGMVPLCAMRVARSSDGGDLTPAVPPTSCGCFFEQAISGTTAAPCTTCKEAADCTGAEHCLKGYCE